MKEAGVPEESSFALPPAQFVAPSGLSLGYSSVRELMLETLVTTATAS